MVRISRLVRSSSPLDVVDHGEGRDVVEEGVDGEIAAEGVLLRAAEGVVAADQRVALFGRRLAPEGRDLDHLAPEPHVTEPEPPAHHEAVPEQLLHLLGMGVRRDVEVLRLALQEQVAYTSPDQVTFEPVILQAIEDLQGIGVDVLAGEVVLWPRQDAGHVQASVSSESVRDETVKGAASRPEL